MKDYQDNLNSETNHSNVNENHEDEEDDLSNEDGIDGIMQTEFEGGEEINDEETESENVDDAEEEETVTMDNIPNVRNIPIPRNV